MKAKKIFWPHLLLGITLILTACGGAGGSPAGKSPAAAAVENYYAALVSKDAAKVSNLSCKDWEEQAMLEVDALMSVGAQLNNVSCSQAGEEGADALVVCNGTLDLTYNDEIRAIELDKRTYTMTMEDGQWRVCSYK